MKTFALYSRRFKLNLNPKKTDFLKNFHWCWSKFVQRWLMERLKTSNVVTRSTSSIDWRSYNQKPWLMVLASRYAIGQAPEYWYSDMKTSECFVRCRRFGGCSSLYTKTTNWCMRIGSVTIIIVVVVADIYWLRSRYFLSFLQNKYSIPRRGQ